MCFDQNTKTLFVGHFIPLILLFHPISVTSVKIKLWKTIHLLCYYELAHYGKTCCFYQNASELLRKADFEMSRVPKMQHSMGSLLYAMLMLLLGMSPEGQTVGEDTSLLLGWRCASVFSSWITQIRWCLFLEPAITAVLCSVLERKTKTAGLHIYNL